MSTERRDTIRRLLGFGWVATIVLAVALLLIYVVPWFYHEQVVDRAYRGCVEANPTTPDKWLEMIRTCRNAAEEFAK